MSVILLVRHARSSANAAGLLAGWSPGVDLDDTGRGQAEQLRTRTHQLPLAAVVSSPLQRCRSTAAALPGGESPFVEPDFGEVRYGAWTGRPLSELAGEPLWSTVQERPEEARFPDGPDFPGESMLRVRDRAMQALTSWDERIVAEHGDGAVWAVVSHGDVIKALLAEVCGAGLHHFQRFTADPASVSVVSLRPQPRLLRSNDTAGVFGSEWAASPPAPTVGGGDSPDAPAGSDA